MKIPPVHSQLGTVAEERIQEQSAILADPMIQQRITEVER